MPLSLCLSLFCVSVSLCVCPSPYVSVSLYFILSLSVSLYLSLYICVSVSHFLRLCLLLSLSLYLSFQICLSIVFFFSDTRSLCVYHSLLVSVSLCISCSLCLSLYVPLCLSRSLSHYVFGSYFYPCQGRRKRSGWFDCRWNNISPKKVGQTERGLCRHSVTDIMSGSTIRAGAIGTLSPVISRLHLIASLIDKYCRGCLQCCEFDYLLGSFKQLHIALYSY